MSDMEYSSGTVHADPNRPVRFQSDVAGNLKVTNGGTAPVGGGITWGAPTAVAMTGASKNLVAANPLRKGIIFWNKSGNSPAAYDLSGGTVTLAGNIALVAGGTPTVLTAPECPVGAITVIGTNLDNLYYQEGT